MSSTELVMEGNRGTRGLGASAATVVAMVVHFYTALGVVVAFLAAHAIVLEDYRAAFLWLTAAMLIDATDGWLARRVRVRERLPAVDGARLDDVVDYVTFVFVPAFLFHRAHLLPDGWSAVILSAVLLSSAYAFSRVDAKTPDHFFTGFPSYWNVVAFYLYAADLPPAFNAAVLLTLCALVFVPIRYVYPSRMPTLRGITLTAGAIWGGVIAMLVLQLPDVSRQLLLVSLLFPLYYTVISIVLHGRRGSAPS